MSSSLSEQLRRLAVPQTSALQRDKKKRASLLFDPREAAGLKRETVFQIGLDGLEELINKNEIFEQFKNNLFHISSKKFERSMETAESNRKLDKEIRKFLLLLSPYFLFNCSHKALEWLINRYGIHEFNREDLLMTALPYHESNVFVRIVQLMKFKDHNDNWFFLKSLQKPGVHLTKQNLLHHAASDVYFLKFVAKFMKLLLKQHEKPQLLTVAFNFYCASFAGAIEYTRELNEAQITQMLPTLLKGLNSNIADYCSASYVILGRLVMKTTLTDIVLGKFIERIAEANVESLKTEITLILLVIYQSQTHYKTLPELACTSLAKKEWLPKVLQELNDGNCYIQPFLYALVTSCLNGAVRLDQDFQRKFIKKLLDALKLDDEFVEILLGILLEGIKEMKTYPEHIQKWHTEIIQTLERQYPNQFDMEAYKVLSLRHKSLIIPSDQITTLCNVAQPNDWTAFVTIIPHLLPNSDEQLKFAKKLTNTPFIKNNRFLKNIDSAVADYELFCNSVFDSLDNKDMQLVKDFIKQISPICKEGNVLEKYIITVILSCIQPQGTSVEANALIIETCVNLFATCPTKFGKSNAFFQDHLISARNGKFHMEAFLLCLKNIILKTKKPAVDFSQVDFSIDNDFNKYFLWLATTLFKTYSNHQKYILFFIRYFCEGLSTKIEFLLNLALFCGGKSPEISIICLNVLINLLEHALAREIQDLSLLSTQEGVLAVYLLALLANTSRGIKENVFKIINIFSQTIQVERYKLLFRELLNQEEEIISDSTQLSLIIYNFVTSATIKGKKVLAEVNILKSELLKYSCSSNSPLYLKNNILAILSQMNSVEIFEDTALDCITLLQTDAKSFSEVKSSIIIHNIQRYQENISNAISLQSNVWNLLVILLKTDNISITVDDKISCPAVLILRQLDKNVFGSFNEDVAAKVLDLVIETTTVSKNSDVLPEARRLIKIVELDSQLILPHFIAMRDVQSPRLDPNKLKRRISVVPTIDILDTLAWRKGVTALEFIQEKKKLRNTELLLPVLFDILKKCLDFDEQTAVEYPKQLILSSILYLGAKIEQKFLTETVFNIELIVQCIRASQNPQTHYCALLVLSFAAGLFPSQVLHHTMTIFTFMGSSLLRHEDAYSFQIIGKTINTIVPILIQNSTSDKIANVLRVFVDVLVDVPEHRRLSIYKQLIDKIGVNDHLHIFLLLIFESHVNHSDRNKNEDLKRLEIAAAICREFPPKSVLKSCVQLIKYLKDLPDEIDKNNWSSLYGILYKNPKQFRHFKYTLILFLIRLLTSKEFINQIAVMPNDSLLELEELYKNVIVNILTYIQRVSKVAEKTSKAAQGKYWKVILHLSYDILDSVNALLTPQMFLLVMKGLMVHSFLTVRRRSLELLNTKLQNDSTFFLERPHNEIYSLVPPLINSIKMIEDTDLETEEEILIQTALLSLKLLVKFLIQDYSSQLSEILDFLTNLIKSGKAQNNVLASLILCLAELCSSLRAHALSSMPRYMPALIKTLKHQKNNDTSSLLLLSCLTAIQKILENLSLFLSPYLEKLVFELSILSKKWPQETEDEKLQPIINKLLLIRQQMGKLIPSRVLIPVLGQTYTRLLEKKIFDSIGFIMEVLEENLQNLNGNEINSNLSELTTFFLNALQFRTEQRATFKQTNIVEAKIVKALTKLILKLSESSFKPLYYKLFDWAIRSEVRSERIITFYALSSSIAESLKSIFVLFAGHFINNAAQILDSCNTIKNDTLYFDEQEKNELLLGHVLKTLHTVFTYDNSKFISKDRFEILMQPLVDQLENTLDGVEELERRNDSVITPCIVQFAVATADDSLWKQLNYQILLKMKHNVPNIRLIALYCMNEMVRKVGVDYLPLLPESIPVLAELLEDEDETVEKACRKAVQEMEKVLGEPIEKYFKM